MLRGHQRAGARLRLFRGAAGAPNCSPGRGAADGGELRQAAACCYQLLEITHAAGLIANAHLKRLLWSGLFCSRLRQLVVHRDYGSFWRVGYRVVGALSDRVGPSLTPRDRHSPRDKILGKLRNQFAHFGLRPRAHRARAHISQCADRHGKLRDVVAVRRLDNDQ
jgi:hypothetical protein